MIRRGGLVLAILGLLLVAPSPALADERPPAQDLSVSLALTTTAMAEVREPFQVTVRLGDKARNVVAVLQVKSKNGYVTQQRLALDARGRATGLVVSKRAAVRTYRAVVLSARGRVLTASAPVSVTWAPLTYTVSLACTRDSAPVRVDIPCTITVTPPVRLDNMLASLQVMGRTGWVPLEAMRVPAKGTLASHVAGREAGEGVYRVVLLRDARVIAESEAVRIAYSAP